MVNSQKNWLNVVWMMIFICGSSYFGYTKGSQRDERRLLEDLLKEYNVNERPVANASDILVVKLRLLYRQLVELEEPTQSMKSLVWLKMTWKDVNLKWNTSKYGGYSTTRIDSSRIWTPDLTLYNNVDERGGDLYSFKTKITLTADGTAVWLAPTILQSICILDISKFPFDKQQCYLKVGSWVHDGFAIDLNMETENEPDIDLFRKNTEWDLVSASAIKNSIVYDCCPAPFYDITYTINFNRKHLYYIMTIIFPCVLLSFLATISFLFPADSGERISLVISVLLGLIVFMLIVNDKTPVTSESVPMITQYFSAIGFLIFLSLLATAVVLRMNHASALQPVSGFLKKVRNFVARMLCMTKGSCRKPMQLDFGDVLLADVDRWFDLREQLMVTAKRKRTTEEMVLSVMKKFAKRLEQEDFANEIKEDWKYTGRVLDQFFFYFFLLAFTSISVYVVSFIM